MTTELIIDGDNDVYWYRNNELHNKYGPAFIWSSGSKAWWVNGQRHRINGPSIVFADGTKMWYVNGVKCQFGLEYLVAIEEFATNK